MSKVALSGNALGSGTLTIAAPNTSTDRIINLPDSNGTILTTATAGVPVNGPAFSAYFTGTQSVTSNTVTKATVNTEVFDTNSNYDPSTNYRFTPTVAGYYQVSFALEGGATAGTCQAVNAIPYKNGAVINGLTFTYGAYLYPTAVNGGSSTGTVLVYMNGSTDFLELYLKVIGTAPTVSNAYFSAFLARSAT
jgi:hypothetical protein